MLTSSAVVSSVSVVIAGVAMSSTSVVIVAGAVVSARAGSGSVCAAFIALLYKNQQTIIVSAVTKTVT